MVMESGFSSPRATESFPAGLRVLVVDDDPTWLKILEKMLKKCNYDVTTCGLAREALKLLRDRKDGYDIVISDVNMPDMDGFKLLEHVGLEMDLPVIMMSVDGETSRVMKGVQHGACDYLLKPIRMKELKNIWQHVLRKRMHEVRDIESHDSMDDFHLFKYAADLADDGHFYGGGDQIFLRKRKDIDSKHGDRDSNDPSSKKPRVVWSVDLHQKFVKAVNHIGFDKVGPKKILDLMNVPWLTRENVASHLQKYRLYLSRLQKENELKSGCGVLKNADQSSKDVGGSFGVHSSTRCPDYKLPVQSPDTNPHEIAPKGINLPPLTEPRTPFNSDTLGGPKAASSPNMGLEHSLGSLKSEINYASFECPLASQFAWSGEVNDSPFKFERKPHQQDASELPFECKPSNIIEDCFNNQPTACFSSRPSVFEGDNMGYGDNKKLLTSDISNGIIDQSFLIGQTDGSLSHSEPCALNAEIYGANTLPDMNQYVNQDGLLGLELGPSNHILGSELDIGSWTDDLNLHLLQGDSYATTSMGFDYLGFSEYNVPVPLNEVSPMCFYGAPRFDYEHPNDSIEYAVVDPGLSIS